MVPNMTSEVRARLNALRSSLKESRNAASTNFQTLRTEEAAAKPVSRQATLESLLERIKVNAYAYSEADEIPHSSNAAHGLPRNKDLVIS